MNGVLKFCIPFFARFKRTICVLQCAFLCAFLGAFVVACVGAVSSACWCGSVRMGAYRYVWVRMGALKVR